MLYTNARLIEGVYIGMENYALIGVIIVVAVLFIFYIVYKIMFWHNERVQYRNNQNNYRNSRDDEDDDDEDEENEYDWYLEEDLD